MFFVEVLGDIYGISLLELTLQKERAKKKKKTEKTPEISRVLRAV
ncbi:hypothetical protein APHCRT_1625 [Anaplasma phagocytophilum str. CRT53-1]|uniref:Uncharacterized protein n=1 Tax=Anaplasma phagocytophilum str. CRT53-1 TaxID=1359157 RepID=A0A0F3PLA3_ANAPH|nr:hypothetical protein APHCRT_1625 [Anaplasma phagocytophilum str. CRT53-1]